MIPKSFLNYSTLSYSFARFAAKITGNSGKAFIVSDIQADLAA
jgi:hypothetical protein